MKTMAVKKLHLFVFVVVLTLIAGTPYGQSCTVGTKDCRHQWDPVKQQPDPNVCYWWECQQVTKDTTAWIFLGTRCTCPANSKLDPGSIQTAENVVSGVEVRRLEPQTTGTCDCSKCRSDQYCCPTANGYCGCFPMPCP